MFRNSGTLVRTSCSIPTRSHCFFLSMHSPESGLERQVKEILHKAFWEILREELDSDPPQFKQVSPAQGILGDNQGGAGLWPTTIQTDNSCTRHSRRECSRAGPFFTGSGFLFRRLRVSFSPDPTPAPAPIKSRLNFFYNHPTFLTNNLFVSIRFLISL